MLLFGNAKTPTSTGIPVLSSWADLVLIILFGLPVVIQLWRIFFVKPKIKLVALPPFEYSAHVNWFNEEGKWEDLGIRKVFFTYLNVINNGRANARDCSVLFTTPEENGEHVFPEELPLLYASFVGDGFDINAGVQIPYRISVEKGKPIQMVSSRTIAQKGGKTTVLLLFVIEGFDLSIVAVAKGTAGFDVEPKIIKLRTSVDGKLHRVKLNPMPNGSYAAEVLN
jgi:hypothetical protein